MKLTKEMIGKKVKMSIWNGSAAPHGFLRGVCGNKVWIEFVGESGPSRFNDFENGGFELVEDSFVSNPKKPSERIAELAAEISTGLKEPITTGWSGFSAILRYLDEEFEKEHK